MPHGIKRPNRQRREIMSSAANPKAIDSKKPTTKQELIAANIKLLIEQLEAGHSEALTEYLTAMSRFHNYSFGNVLEIARQMPNATRVAGFWAWKQLGRSVKSCEKGIRILAPIVGVKGKKDEEAEKDITKQNMRVLVGFRNAYVFDISQTEGVDLPELREMSGDVGENRDRLVSFIEKQGIALTYTEKIAPALGMSYAGRIAILPGQSKAEEFSTLVHELALGTIIVTKAALTYFREKKAGHFIQFSSVGGRIGPPGRGPYSAAKWGVEGFSEVLSREVARLGIKVTIVEPGGFRTDFAGSSTELREGHPEYDSTVGATARFQRNYNGKQPGDPKKAAQAIVQLTQERNPPLRLLLGSDAYVAAEKNDLARLEEARIWKKLSVSTDFETK